MSRVRFQFLCFDMTHDTNPNAQTDRWRNHFKSIIKELAFHPDDSNIVKLGFSLLAHDPMKLAKKEEQPYCYVSHFVFIINEKIYAAGALAPYTKRFQKHQEALDFIDEVADLGIARHIQDSFKTATHERWEKSGYNPSRYLFISRDSIFSFCSVLSWPTCG